jgi:hypothetical protein
MGLTSVAFSSYICPLTQSQSEGKPGDQAYDALAEKLKSNLTTTPIDNPNPTA